MPWKAVADRFVIYKITKPTSRRFACDILYQASVAVPAKRSIVWGCRMRRSTNAV